MKISITASVFLLTALVSSAGNARAAELRGSIHDDSGGPVSGASVFIRELNTVTVSAPDGSFRMKGLPDGTYTVRASRIGYAALSATATVPSETPLVLTMKVSPVEAEEVVTTARGRETSVADIPGKVEIVTADEIAGQVPVSIPAALSRKPGLAAGYDMPWSQRVVIRGLMKDQVVMLVDGCRVVTATETAAEFGTVAQADIERVEVLKGPISVLYGSGSTGGVVNVITRKSRFSDTPGIGFSLSPSFDSSAGGAGMYERAEFSSPRLYLGVSQANRDYGDYDAAGGLTVRNSGFRDRQTQVNLGFKPAESHLVEIRRQDFTASDVGIPGARSFPKDATADYPRTTRTLTDLSWTWRPAVSWWKESRANGYYQPIHRDVELFPHTVQNAPGKRITVDSIYPGAYHRVSGGRWRNVFAFGGHTVSAGIETWRKNMESYRTKNLTVELLDSGGAVTKTMTSAIKDKPLPDSSQQPFGVFAEDSFHAGRRLKLTVGGRFDMIRTKNDLTYKQYSPPDTTILWKAQKDTDRSWSFVAGGIYNASEWLDLNFTAARSFRAPTIEERYLYADLGGVLTVGNPLINPEKGTFVEGGFAARTGAFRFGGQAYANSLTDMVTQAAGTFSDGRSAWISMNAGKALLWGFEAEADWAAAGNFLVSADASWTRGTDTKTHADLPFMPPPRGHVSVRWNAGRGFWIEPLATFTGRQDRVAKGELTTPGYGIVDVSAGKTFARGGNLSSEIVLGVRNLGDRLYRDHLATSRGYEMYGIGRSVYASLRMNYR